MFLGDTRSGHWVILNENLNYTHTSSEANDSVITWDQSNINNDSFTNDSITEVQCGNFHESEFNVDKILDSVNTDPVFASSRDVSISDDELFEYDIEEESIDKNIDDTKNYNVHSPNENVEKTSKSNEMLENAIPAETEDSVELAITDTSIETIQRNMKNYSFEETAFHQNILISVPRTFWEQFLPPEGDRRLLNGWTDEFNKIFKQTFPYCVFSTIDSRFYHQKKKNNKYFWVKAFCTHTSCTHFYMVVYEKIEKPFSEIYDMKVFHNAIDHSGKETRRRFYRKKAREELATDLRQKTAAVVKWERLNNTPKDVLKMGNYNTAPSTTILNKIKSDDRKKKDLHSNEFLFMDELQKKYIESYDNRIIEGYIHFWAINANSLMIILFSERQLRYLADQKELFFNLDSTGSIAAQPSSLNATVSVYYYGLFYPGGTDFSPLEAAEAIMSLHSVSAVSFFLSQFYNKFRLITSKKIKKIETDFSTVLLTAVTLTFNGVNLYDYIKKIYSDEIKNTRSDLTILHSCSSHLIKGFKG